MSSSSSSSSIHPPVGLPPPYPSTNNSQVPLKDRHINWAGREVICRLEPNLRYSYVSAVNRVGGLALYAFGTLIAGMLIKCALYAPIGATILLGIPGIPISLIFFTLGNLVWTQATPQIETLEDRITREKEIERKLINNPNLRWKDVKAMFKNQNTFSKEELDYIFFENQVNTLTGRQFTERHGVEGIQMLTDFRKATLKNKFLNEISGEKRGLLALTKVYAHEMSLFGVTRLDIWNRIKEAELAFLFSDVILRNGDIRPYLTAQEKIMLANDPDQAVDLSDLTRPLSDITEFDFEN